MANNSDPRLPQQAEMAGDAVSPIEPEVRDIECVESTQLAYFSLARNLEDFTTFIKLVRQSVEPLQQPEYENAKLIVLSYLSHPHIAKLTDIHLNSFLEAIGILRRDPALSAHMYDKLTVLKHRFPQLVYAFHKARREKQNAKAFLSNNDGVLKHIRNLNDEAKKKTQAYQKLESEIRNINNKPENVKVQLQCHAQRAMDKFGEIEKASLRIHSADREICRILNEVEELCSNINL